MKISERLALIKAGYTRKEIELMIKEESESKPEDSESSKDGAADKEAAGDGKKDLPPTETEPDAKTEELEGLKASIDELKETIKGMQKANRNTDHSGSIQPDKSVTDLIKECIE